MLGVEAGLGVVAVLVVGVALGGVVGAPVVVAIWLAANRRRLVTLPSDPSTVRYTSCWACEQLNGTSTAAGLRPGPTTAGRPEANGCCEASGVFASTATQTFVASVVVHVNGTWTTASDELQSTIPSGWAGEANELIAAPAAGAVAELRVVVVREVVALLVVVRPGVAVVDFVAALGAADEPAPPPGPALPPEVVRAAMK